MKDRTKWIFANELKEMLEYQSLEKVHVIDLCERCGERRQVFYYHFKDKYDLVAWIYDQGYAKAGKDPNVQGYYAFVVRMLEYLWENKDFYNRAFNDKSQNCIEKFIHERNYEISESAVKKFFGLDHLSAKQRHDIIFHSQGSVGTTIEWLSGKLVATPEELAYWEIERMPAFLHEAFMAGV